MKFELIEKESWNIFLKKFEIENQINQEKIKKNKVEN